MTQEFALFAAVGFFAQVIDGALGMAYGAISATALLAFGIPPAFTSASVHVAEVFTTAAAGASHVWHRNVDWRLFAMLAPTGVAGGVLGAYVLTGVDPDAIKPFITVYLALVGGLILFKAYRKFPEKPLSGRLVMPLGLIGGFVDALGGGGWGPVVSSSLIGSGGSPRMVIGSVSAVEFVVTLSVSLTFLFALLSGHWVIAGEPARAAIAGLIIGGLLAAPLAGLALKIIPSRPLTALAGTIVLALAGYQALTWRIS